MALDYSKLTDEELEAITYDYYSKLSDRTLRQLTRDPSAQTVPNAETPEVNLLPQAVSGVKAAIPEVVGVAQQVRGLDAAKGVTANIRDVGNVANILAQNVSSGTAGEFMQNPIKNTARLAGAYMAGHPYTQAIGNIASGARNIGGALVTGAVAPESAFMMPYQMAAYEQEKIRANPDAPEYATNPYAMSYRSQGTANPITQGQAGAQNQRNLVANMPYGNVTPQERAMLDKDRLNMAVRLQAAKRILGQQ
jgi:hypothetical protein